MNQKVKRRHPGAKQPTPCSKGAGLRWCPQLTMGILKLMICYDTPRVSCIKPWCFMANSKILRFGHTHMLWCSKKLLITFDLQCLKTGVKKFEASMSKAIEGFRADTMSVRQTKWWLWSKMVDTLWGLAHGSKNIFVYSEVQHFQKLTVLIRF